MGVVCQDGWYHTFWIASDYNGEFWLSTDDEKAHKVLKCTVPSWTDPMGWDQYPVQKSSVISLVAGQAYYYEVRSVCIIFEFNLYAHSSFDYLCFLMIPPSY